MPAVEIARGLPRQPSHRRATQTPRKNSGAFESQTLAPYGLKSHDSKGRADCGSSAYTLSLEASQGAPVTPLPPTVNPTPSRAPTATRVSAPLASPATVSARRINPSTTTPPATLVAKIAPTAANLARGETRLQMGASGGTAFNRAAGVLVRFKPGALPEGALVMLVTAQTVISTSVFCEEKSPSSDNEISRSARNDRRAEQLLMLRPLPAGETLEARGKFELVGNAVEIIARDRAGNELDDFETRPVQLCFIYTAEQLALAEGRAEDFVVLRNPGEEDEAEVALNRRGDEAARQICVETTRLSTWALARRVPRGDQDAVIALAWGALNLAALTLCGGAVILAWLAVCVKAGWWRRK